jgi:hypothetical protein
MAGFDTASGASYGTIAAFVFVFNLVVGVGRLQKHCLLSFNRLITRFVHCAGGLTMPVNFQKVGYILGPMFVLFLGFLSYMTVTFVIEAMAAANAMLLHQKSECLWLQDLLSWNADAHCVYV